jgi:predicted ATPase
MIKRLRAQNFKSLRDLDLDLGANNVLVGPNMSGKSNVVDLFRFLNQLVSPPGAGMMPLAGALSKFGGIKEVVWKGGDSPGFTVGLEGSVSAAGPVGSSPARAPSRRTQGGQTDEPWASSGFRYELAIQGNDWGFAQVQRERLELTNGDGPRDVIATEQGARLIKRSDGSVLASLGMDGSTVIEQNMPGWEGGSIRSLIAGFRFYNLFPLSMKTHNPTAAAQFLSELGDNLASWLMTVQTQYKSWFSRVELAMIDAFPDIESLFTQPTQQSTVFVGSEERFLRRPTSVFQMSDGELAFLALLSLVYAPPELCAPLYCIEEPENHLHPRLLETFVGLLRQRQAEFPEAERPTFVFTTHSPLLLDHFDLDDVVVVEKREGATVFTRPGNRKELKDLLARKELGLGNLFYSGALGGA